MEQTSLSRLTDRELLLHADNARDPLTSSEIEIELAMRFERLVGLSEIEDAAKNFDIAVDDIPAIAEALNDHNATELKVLRQKLKRADEFYDIARDAGDVIARLNTLATETI
jgi:hypothetical protein